PRPSSAPSPTRRASDLVQHPLHPSFLVSKLWGYLVGAPAPAGVVRALAHAYRSSGYEIRPLVEAVLRHPLLYKGPRMVVPPVVRSEEHTSELQSISYAV